MKMKLLLALSFSLEAACAGHLGPQALPSIPLDVDPSIAIFALNGEGGHACPVNGTILTARHVMWDEDTNRFVGASWSYQGQRGGALVAEESLYQDAVALEMTEGTFHYLMLGTLPEVGDTLYWYEYDFRTKSNAYRARRRLASVLRLVAGHIILDGEPTAGASGTCVINKRGEAVGIIIAGMTTDDGQTVGIAAAP